MKQDREKLGEKIVSVFDKSIIIGFVQHSQEYITTFQTDIRCISL